MNLKNNGFIKKKMILMNIMFQMYLLKVSVEPLESKSYLLDGEFFSIVKEDGTKMTGQCKNCFENNSRTKLSTGDFLSHIKVINYKLFSNYYLYYFNFKYLHLIFLLNRNKYL